MSKPVLWLFMAAMDNPEAALTIPALAWIAETHGARFEMYLEGEARWPAVCQRR